MLPGEEAKLPNLESHRLETLYSIRAISPPSLPSGADLDPGAIHNRPYRRTDDLYIEVLLAQEPTDNTLITFTSDLY